MNTERRNHMTPTKDSDISPRARLFDRITDHLAFSLMEMEGCHGDENNPFYRMAQESILTLEDETKRAGFLVSTVYLVAGHKIRAMKEAEGEEELEPLGQGRAVPSRGVPDIKGRDL